MIFYTDSGEHLTAEHLYGFFVGWPTPPSPERHLRLLHQSDAIVLAIDDETGQVVGYITAITDKVLTAFIPLLEVLPNYQAQGIGSELVRRMIAKLQSYYALDLMCDPELQSFYEKLGFQPATGMMLRNYDHQSGHE